MTTKAHLTLTCEQNIYKIEYTKEMKPEEIGLSSLAMGYALDAKSFTTIYILSPTTDIQDGFYVGETRNPEQRLAQHLIDAFRFSADNHKKNAIIKYYWVVKNCSLHMIPIATIQTTDRKIAAAGERHVRKLLNDKCELINPYLGDKHGPVESLMLHDNLLALLQMQEVA